MRALAVRTLGAGIVLFLAGWWYLWGETEIEVAVGVGIAAVGVALMVLATRGER